MRKSGEQTSQAGAIRGLLFRLRRKNIKEGRGEAVIKSENTFRSRGINPGEPCEGNAGPGLYSRWNFQAPLQASRLTAGVHTTGGLKVPFLMLVRSAHLVITRTPGRMPEKCF